MKKLSTLLLLCLTALVSFGQKLKTRVDEKTHDTTFFTTGFKISQRMTFTDTYKLTCYLLEDKGKFTLFLNPSKGGATSKIFYITSDNKATIKLTDGKLVTLQANATKVADIKSNDAFGLESATNSVVMSYDVSADNASLLKSTPVSFVSIESSIGNLDYEIKPKSGDMIQKAFGLLPNK